MIRIIKATITAFIAIAFLRLLLKSAVIEIKIGITPKGFISVKKDVTTMKAYSYVLIDMDINLIIKPSKIDGFETNIRAKKNQLE
jgi:hypothetical protein